MDDPAVEISHTIFGYLLLMETRLICLTQFFTLLQALHAPQNLLTRAFPMADKVVRLLRNGRVTVRWIWWCQDIRAQALWCGDACLTVKHSQQQPIVSFQDRRLKHLSW